MPPGRQACLASGRTNWPCQGFSTWQVRFERPADPSKFSTREVEMVSFTVNGETLQFDGDPSLPLLWFLRDERGLTGTKFGCGIAQCGACTVHVDGETRRSCVTPVGNLEGAQVTTIEG